ncbi:hypothetical protein Nm8I071_23590 [Nonomuraea sp. TT08I-71]|nr:hypothetical protein Nm8I071_23590 [Nonomuraea sp. TT08I-71]
MSNRVRLLPINDEMLELLLAVAVAEAKPEEVMPPVEAPPGWSPARREAFREFHRASYGGLDGPTRNQMYVVVVGDEVVGMAALGGLHEPGAAETGMWLGRPMRGRGVGAAALTEVMQEAARLGLRSVVARTTRTNVAALTVLAKFGARLRSEGEDVHAANP